IATTKEKLSPWDKFTLAANNSIAVSTIGASLVGAAYGQAIDSPEGYGQGGEGPRQAFRCKHGARRFRQHVRHLPDCLHHARGSALLRKQGPLIPPIGEVRRRPGRENSQ